MAPGYEHRIRQLTVIRSDDLCKGYAALTASLLVQSNSYLPLKLRIT